MKNILITGGAGFIGSHLVKYFVKKYSNYNIINVDNLTYAANLENLKEISNYTNYKFEKLDTLCHIVEVQSAVTKAYKDKVKEVGSSQFVFTRKEYDKAMYTADALLQNDVWQELTRGAQFEKPAFDILHGYPFRAKADVLGDGYIADLKTTSDLKGFKWAAKKYSYDVQLYIYCNLFKVDWRDFKFFVIDKSSGDLGIYDVEETFYESGKYKLEKGLEVFEKYFVNMEEDLNTYVIRDTLE